MIDWRKLFVKRAKEHVEKYVEEFLENVNEVKKHGKKVRARGSSATPAENDIHPSEYKDPVPFSHR